MASFPYIQAFLFLATVVFLSQWCRSKRRWHLPPGPVGLPLVGNLMDLPRNGTPEYITWLKYKDRYRSISSINVLGQILVIIHDKEAAFELMMKRSLKHSSRPSMEFAFKLAGFGEFTSSHPYNDTLRLHRKLIHKEIGTDTAIAKFQDIQRSAVGKFIRNVFQDPERLFGHIDVESNSIILKMLYGYTIDTKAQDPLAELNKRMMNAFSKSSQPGVWLVDALPGLKHLPSWIPGTGFLRTASLWKKIAFAGADVPLKYVKQRMRDGSHQPSYVANLLEQLQTDHGSAYESAIKWSAGSLYGGGTDTTACWLRVFFLCMLKFPDVQRKAREEIYQIVGHARLPDFGDRQKLKYIDAVIRETHRWHPVTPLGLPHLTDETDIYKDYLIPKNAILVPVTWWFAHDPSTYLPERFLAPFDEQDPRDFIFGIGRRVCPGRLLAEANIFLTVVQFLAVFDIQKAVDDDGLEIDPELQPSAGTISCPKEYPFQVNLRSQKHLDLLQEADVTQHVKESDAHYLRRHGLVPDLEEDDTVTRMTL